MIGKKVKQKVIGKNHRKLRPRKLDMKKMEELNFLGALVAEMTAVQVELKEKMDDGLRRSEWNTNENLQGLQITAHRLRQANILVAQLNAIVHNVLDGLLDVFDLAGEDKGH